MEAYVFFGIGIILALLGIAGQVGEEIMLSGILVGVTFLVFNSTSKKASASGAAVLRGRENFGTVATLLAEAREMWVYAPSAVSLLVNAADIRRCILTQGGRCRFVIQDPSSPSVQLTIAQLDDNVDFVTTLGASLTTLNRLRDGHPDNFDFRLLDFSPGFSIVFINPASYSGYAILELHGFRDDSIADRMHLKIERLNSPRWFEYWKRRYEEIWSSARVSGR